MLTLCDLKVIPPFSPVYFVWYCSIANKPFFYQTDGTFCAIAALLWHIPHQYQGKKWMDICDIDKCMKRGGLNLLLLEAVVSCFRTCHIQSVTNYY